MSKENKKEKDYQKLQSKLQKQGITFYQILQDDAVVQSFRANNVLLHNFLKMKNFRDMVEYVTVLGSPHDTTRAFKFPQVSCEILSSQNPKIWQVMFSMIEDNRPHILLMDILKYFDGLSDYTLSGYVMKILNSLYICEPVRTQQALMESGKLSKMVDFTMSRSVSQFLIKVIVVQNESILTLFFKQRRDLFAQLIAIYQKNDKQQEYLSQISFILGEIMNKLWGSKHKQLGRFSQLLLQLVQIIISKSKLCNQQSLMFIIIKYLTNYIDDAPFLIKAILAKSYKQISSSSFETFKSTHKVPVTKFGHKKFKLLQCLSSAFSNCISLVQSMPNVHVYFSTFLNLIVKHQWNNIVHVQVQTIFRETFKSGTQNLFKSMFQKGRFGQAVKDLIKKQQRKQPKQVKGYLGTLVNIVTFMNEGVIKNTQLGNFLLKEQASFVQVIKQFLQTKQSNYIFDLAGYSVNLKNSIPQYDQTDLLQKYKDFIDNTNQTLASELINSISSTSDNIIFQTFNNEIEDQNVINSKFYEQDTTSTQKTASP